MARFASGTGTLKRAGWRFLGTIGIILERVDPCVAPKLIQGNVENSSALNRPHFFRFDSAVQAVWRPLYTHLVLGGRDPDLLLRSSVVRATIEPFDSSMTHGQG